MEFFREIKIKDLDYQKLKETLLISTLPRYCASIETVIFAEGSKGEIYCLWGQFSISKEILKYGVRFSLLNCPHALAWSITYNEENQALIIHCTIDKKDEDKDFIESIHQFVSDWEKGLATIFQ